MDNNSTTIPAVQSTDMGFDQNMTGATQEKKTVSGGNNQGSGSLSITRVVEIVSLIGGLVTLIVFIVSIIITQNNIQNSIVNMDNTNKTNLQDLQKEIDNYHDDNILIKTQIENWFNKIDISLDTLKSRK